MASLPPGTLLGSGKYRVVREINRGGTAVVYECDALRDGAAIGQRVALKVMSVKSGKQSAPIKGVKREIQYTASVQHANVVQLIDFFAEEHHVVIVWELISGPDLLDLLNECGGRLREEDAARYFAQLLRGVTFIHERGLCHRDLKPENVMLDRATGRIKIIDFGLSKHAHSAVTLGVGTPDYMAPELLGNGSVATLYERHTGVYDAQAADIWALGVMLFLLVTGLYPFEDPANPQNVVATLQNIMAGCIRALPPHVSPACTHLIRSMLVRDPARRITLSGIAAHPWVLSCGAVRMAEVGEAQAPPTPGAPRANSTTAGLGDPTPASAPACPASPLPPATPPPKAPRHTVAEDSPSFSLAAHAGAPLHPPPGRLEGGASFSFADSRTPSACATPRLTTATPAQAMRRPSAPRSPSFSQRVGDRDAVLRLLPEPVGESAREQRWGETSRAEGSHGRLGNLCRLWFGSGSGGDVCGR